MHNDKSYKEFIVELLNDPNFDTLIEDIKSNLLKKISNSKPEEKDLREQLYYQIQGVDTVKKSVVLAAKRKVTGGTE